MDYSEFNGLGLLGQSIKQIKEDDIQPVLPKYDDFLENRSTIDNELTLFIEKNKDKVPEKTPNNIDKFLEYFLNNNNEEYYNGIKTLESRILTLDNAFTILKNEYDTHYSKFLASYEKPEEYHKIMVSYLYIKSVSEFLERARNKFNQFSKIPTGSLVEKDITKP